MKKILRSMILVLCFILLLSNNQVFGQSIEVDEFYDIDFSTQPLLTQSDKTKCIITWTTDKEIKYLKVSLQLQNNKEQIPYESGRENSAGEFSTSIMENGKYYNVLEIEVDNSQLGNIKIKFNYGYQIYLPGSDMEILSFTAVFVTGKWIDKQPTQNGFLVGIFITAIVSIATYVIIENNRREVLNDDIEENNDE